MSGKNSYQKNCPGKITVNNIARLRTPAARAHFASRKDQFVSVNITAGIGKPCMARFPMNVVHLPVDVHRHGNVEVFRMPDRFEHGGLGGRHEFQSDLWRVDYR